MKGKKIVTATNPLQEIKSKTIINTNTNTNTNTATKPSNKAISNHKGNESNYSSLKILKRLSNETIDNKEPARLKPLLRPFSAKKKKQIEKITIECDTDKVEDNEYLNSLSQNELSFYRKHTSGLYSFLLDLSLVRYIDDFIQDGFETENDLLLINDDYFEVNKAFDHLQQKKIVDKVKELALRKSAKPKNETCEFGTNTNSDKDTYNKLAIRCWNCLNPIIETIQCVSKEYHNGLIMEKINFCNENCMQEFERLIIFVRCKECNKIFDKAKGDIVVDNNHYCSKKCLNDSGRKTQLNAQAYYDEGDETGKDYHYDPMEDF